MRDELAVVNSSLAFWQALDGDFSHATCGHDHGQGEAHFHMAGNFLTAQEKILDAINVVFGENFNAENHQHRDDLFTLASVQKAQDQLSGGKDFVSQRTLNFNKYFKIADSLGGKKIAGETVAMPSAKEYLVKKFKLNSTRAKANVIMASQDSAFKKAENLIDLGFKDAVEPLVEISQSVYKAAPSLAVAGLTLGTAQMILRAANEQEAANKLRDNIGASTEAAAFFVLVNGVLENLSHSFILAAPAFVATAGYDAAQKSLKKIYDYFLPTQTEQVSEVIDVEMGDLNEVDVAFGSFSNPQKTINLLQKAQILINQDQMWLGLRKHQLAYQNNGLEGDLKTGVSQLISALEQNPERINFLLQKTFNQVVRDSFEMLQAYREVYRQQNPASEVENFVSDFCDHFSRDAILLLEPSENAKMAAFCCRSYAGLVSFEERIKESLPHMPTGSQVFLAATVIGALYSASAIYKAATGEEEVYSDYVTNFPDHLFDWLQLDQMYQNMGGGAEATEAFKKFFAGFNLAENSTHLGIAAAPFYAYSKMGSKMFEGLGHNSANYLAYAADLTKDYANAAFGAVSDFLPKRFDVIAPYQETNDSKEFFELSDSPVVFDASTQTEAEEKAAEVPNTEVKQREEVFCAFSPEEFLKQLPQKPVNRRLAHVHGPNCNHK